jgi:hypothetical protein
MLVRINILLVPVLFLSACGTKPADTRLPAAPEAPTTATASLASAPDAQASQAPDAAAILAADSPALPRESPYRLLGILDPGINNMVAFALKVPRGWQVKQTFERQWNGSAPYNQIYLALRSPDGADQIEYLPSTAYFFTDGPMARQMREIAQQYGTQQRVPGELAPMPALAYLKQVLLPRLAQQGMQLTVTGEKATPPQQSASVTTSGAYVSGTLPTGKQARVECQLTMTTTRLNGETYYTWEALPAVVQSSRDLAACYAHAKVAQASVVFNPAWQQQNQQLVSKGVQINSDINRKNHEIRMDAMRSTAEARDAAYQARSASQDRQNEAFGDMIRGEAKYEDQSTGERVKVADQYQHVYTDNQGNYLGSNTPIAAGQVNWQELQRVSTSDY